MKKLMTLLALGLALAVGSAHADPKADCAAKSAEKKLAGAAKTSFEKKCMADAGAMPMAASPACEKNWPAPPRPAISRNAWLTLPLQPNRPPQVRRNSDSVPLVPSHARREPAVCAATAISNSSFARSRSGCNGA